MPSHFDIVIVGSGAGGATLAQRLAPTGKSILILERGEHLPREAENWDPKAVFIQRRYRTQEKWLDKNGHPFTPNTHYWVGGNTTFYGAALMRMRGRDFTEVQHAGGISPAWPISLTDLAPYYAEAETLWQVHGARGEDPTEAGDEPPYAYAAVHHDPGVAALKGHWETQGWRPVLAAAGDQARPGPSGHLDLHQVQDLRRLSLPAQGQVRRPQPGDRAPDGPAQRHPADRPQGPAAGNRPDRPHRHPGGLPGAGG
jgi:choline dehydrogenase-like flavoprotein